MVVGHGGGQDEDLARAATYVRAGFRLADEDGDGVISRKELKVVLKQLGIQWPDDKFDELFREADANDDSVLQYDEFVNYVFGLTDTSNSVEEVDQALFPDATLQQACSEFRHLLIHLPDMDRYPHRTSNEHQRRLLPIRLVAEAVALMACPRLASKRLTWLRARRFILGPSFIPAVIEARGGSLPESVWKAIQKYFHHQDWDLAKLRHASKAASVLGLWVEHQAMQPRDSSDSSDDPGNAAERATQSHSDGEAASSGGEFGGGGPLKAMPREDAKLRPSSAQASLRACKAVPPSREKGLAARTPGADFDLGAAAADGGGGSAGGEAPASLATSQGSVSPAKRSRLQELQATIGRQAELGRPIPKARTQKPRRVLPQNMDYENSVWREILRREFPFQGYIESTENRGITFKQLRRVKHYVARHCCKWLGYASGERSSVSQHLDINSTNLYHANAWLIRPATYEKKCAFVELLAKEDQVPKWFCSHWWGESVMSFLKCIERHVETRGLTGEDPYWVCAYANRQHLLHMELTDDPRESSFFKALALEKCLGVLLILDPRRKESGPATPFFRIWCNFEEAVAVDFDCGLMLDIATCTGGRASVLTQGTTQVDEEKAKRHGTLATRQKMIREQAFPIDIIEAGLNIKVQDGHASEAIDRQHILNCIANQPLEGDPHSAHEAYDRVNTKLRAVFAVAAWRNAAHKGKVEQLRLPEVLSANQWLTSLSLDLSDCQEIQDTKHIGCALDGLAELVSLTVNLSLCRNLCCLQGLGSGLNTHLTALRAVTVHFRICEGLTDLRPLMRGISRLPVLDRLDINANHCVALGVPAGSKDGQKTDLHSWGVEALIGHKHLATVKMEMIDCVGFADGAALVRGMRGLPALRTMYLNLVGCLALPWLMQRIFHSFEALAEVDRALASGAQDLNSTRRQW